MIESTVVGGSVEVPSLGAIDGRSGAMFVGTIEGASEAGSVDIVGVFFIAVVGVMVESTVVGRSVEVPSVGTIDGTSEVVSVRGIADGAPVGTSVSMSGGIGTHTVRRKLVVWPGGQGVHDVRPAVAEIVPGGQRSQSSPPLPKNPAGHCVNSAVGLPVSDSTPFEMVGEEVTDNTSSVGVVIESWTVGKSVDELVVVGTIEGTSDSRSSVGAIVYHNTGGFAAVVGVIVCSSVDDGIES